LAILADESGQTATDPKAKGKMLEVSLILHSTILILKK
jgi:hypothetical protein